MTLLFSETTLTSTDADINNSSWQNTLPGRLNVKRDRKTVRLKALGSSMWKIKHYLCFCFFKWTGTCIRNLIFTLNRVSSVWVWGQVWTKTVPLRQSQAGCEPHREDLAKPWPGYPASPSTQCGRGTQMLLPLSSREMLAWRSSVLPKPATPSTMAAESFSLCLWAILMGIHISIR